MVNQIAVFLENRKGRIYEFSKVLAVANIDLINMSIADTKEFGILRAVTSDNAGAVKCLKEAGFTVAQNDLLGIEVSDAPGGLCEVLKLFYEADVDIEYLYSYAKTNEGKAFILIKADNVEKALDIAKANNLETL